MTAPMHIHFVLHAIGIATLLLIVAYFIFVAGQRSMGFVSAFGTLLGIWLIIIAGVIVAGAVTMPMFGGKPFGLDFPWHHGHGMHPGEPDEAPPPGEPAPAPPEAAPAAPAPAPSGQ